MLTLNEYKQSFTCLFPNKLLKRLPNFDEKNIIFFIKVINCYHSIFRRYFVTSAICWFAAKATAYCWTRVIRTRHVVEYQEVCVYPVWPEVSVSLLLAKKHKEWWHFWVASCRYLGVWLKASRQFKIDLTNLKKSFFRAVNALFSKVLRIASEETMLHLISTKCVPILLYGRGLLPT